MEISSDREASTGINYPEAFRLMCPFAHMGSISNSLLSARKTAELGLTELPRFFCKDIQRQREKTIGLCKLYYDGRTWQFSWNRGEATRPKPLQVQAHRTGYRAKRGFSALSGKLSSLGVFALSPALWHEHRHAYSKPEHCTFTQLHISASRSYKLQTQPRVSI